MEKQKLNIENIIICSRSLADFMERFQLRIGVVVTACCAEGYADKYIN